MNENPEIIRVVCAIIERDGTFLAARRSGGQSQEGLWEFPGGKIRDKETPRQALTREIMEELGVEITVGRPVSPNFHAYPGKTIYLIPFICTAADGDMILTDHDAIEWVDRDTAKNRTWAPADIPILEEYLGC
jgi:8-oxo-dGTP diphosphatase